MNTKKELLLLGQELACIGIAHETARRASEALILQGASASSTEMQQAVQRFRAVDAEWKKVEREYLEVRRRVAGEKRRR